VDLCTDKPGQDLDSFEKDELEDIRVIVRDRSGEIVTVPIKVHFIKNRVNLLFLK